MSVQVYIVIMHSKTVKRFNTSYVSVQVIKLLIRKKESRVSIHPMCRFKITLVHPLPKKFGFNTSYVSVQAYFDNVVAINADRFQYILCVGSRVFRN